MQFSILENNDLSLDKNGQIALVKDTDELVRQRIYCRLRTFRGELFLARGLGVPYFSEVYKKAPNLNQVRDLLISEVRSVDGVEKVEKSEILFDGKQRIFYLYFKCKISNGSEIEVSL